MRNVRCARKNLVSAGVVNLQSKNIVGGDKHAENMKLYQSSKKWLSPLFFRKLLTSSNSPSSTATSNTSSAAADSPSNQTMIDQMVTSQALVTTAECRMILRIVKNHYSFRSCLGLGDDLKAMFPDSAIAAGFTLSKTKCAYVVKYGMAPWLKENLRKVIIESPFFSVSYDESLNRQMQEQQMDLQVRYWCNKTSRAVTRYYLSEFQVHGDHMTMSENLLKGIGDLPDEKLIQTAMDGPNVNWKVLEVIQINREEDEYPLLKDIESCGLYVVSGALQSAVLAADWTVELRRMCKLLMDAPARRAKYMRGSATGLYPEKFCVIR